MESADGLLRLYFAMAFSLGVEMLNLPVRRNRQPVPLHRKDQP